MAFKIDSDLSAVNSVLGAIGQAPITTLNYENPEVGLCMNLIKETSVDVQSEGWYYNTENHLKFTTVGGTGADANRVIVPLNALSMNISGGDIWRYVKVTERNGYLYNKTYHTYDWSNWDGGCVYCNVVWLFEFENIPPTFQRYVTLRASVRAATQLVSNPDLASLLKDQADFQRAACVQENAEMGDNSYMGWPENSVYSPYQPYKALARGNAFGAATMLPNQFRRY